MAGDQQAHSDTKNILSIDALTAIIYLSAQNCMRSTSAPYHTPVVFVMVLFNPWPNRVGVKLSGCKHTKHEKNNETLHATLMNHKSWDIRDKFIMCIRHVTSLRPLKNLS